MLAVELQLTTLTDRSVALDPSFQSFTAELLPNVVDLQAIIPPPKDVVLGDSHILPLLNSAVEERLFIKSKALPAVEKEFMTPTPRYAVVVLFIPNQDMDR